MTFFFQIKENTNESMGAARNKQQIKTNSVLTYF